MNLYLDELIKNKMIEKVESEGKTIIKITKTGNGFYIKYHQMKEFEKTFGL